jgi:N-acetylneuraminate synthase
MTGFPKQFQIAGRPVGQGAPCFVIGEIAQAHDGSLGAAHAEPWRVRFSKQDATRYDYWKRMEFTSEQWAGLKAHCDEVGIVFLSTPFSLEAVEWLKRIDTPAWKMASGEIGNHALLEGCTRTELPILLSSGMSPYQELDDAVAIVSRSKSPLALLQCTTQYPCPPEEVGLNVLAEFQRRYGCPTGLSDHSGEIFPGLAALTLGANLLEVHVTFSKEMFGPDVPASLTLEQLATLLRGVRFIETMLESPIDKDAKAAELEPLRKLFNKSVVLRQDSAAGTILKREHLAIKKPGTGIPAREIDRVVGKKLVHTRPADHLLSEEDLADA